MYKKGLFICLVMLGLNGCVSTEKKETPEEKAYAEKVAKLYWDRVKANAARMEARDKAAAIKAKDERKIAKARLIENEAEILKAMGYDHILLVTGEANKTVGLNYFVNAIRLLKPYFSQISINWKFLSNFAKF